MPFRLTAPPQMAFFNCGGVRLLVGVMPPGQKAQRGSAIYFQVPDIRAVYSSLKGSGVKFNAEPHVVNRTPKSELWLAEFTDPDGNQLALMERSRTVVPNNVLEKTREWIECRHSPHHGASLNAGDRLCC